MKVIHITPSTKGYEIVELLANRVNKNNGFHVIQIADEIHMTGGFILQNTSIIKNVLDNIPKDQQYDFVRTFLTEPWKKAYYEE